MPDVGSGVVSIVKTTDSTTDLEGADGLNSSKTSFGLSGNVKQRKTWEKFGPRCVCQRPLRATALTGTSEREIFIRAYQVQRYTITLHTSCRQSIAGRLLCYKYRKFLHTSGDVRSISATERWNPGKDDRNGK